MSCPHVELSTGARMPMVGLGTWKSEKEEVGAAVRAALHCGYRHIDCAAIYGNEREVGEALASCVGDGPEAICARGDLFLTGKLWNTKHAAKDVEAACQRSLDDLQVQYLDLYLVHWPVCKKKGPVLDPPMSETWAAMEALVERGLVRAIGVSNFSAKKIEEVLSYARIAPAVNQVELHPLLRQDALVKYCQDHRIHLTAYSPLGSGDSDNGKKAEHKPLEDAAVAQVAAQVGKTPAQVLLRWGLQRGTSVIPKSTSQAHIASNLDVVDWELPPAAMEALSNFSAQERICTGQGWIHPAGPYTTLAQLWDEDP